MLSNGILIFSKNVFTQKKKRNKVKAQEHDTQNEATLKTVYSLEKGMSTY